VRKRVWAAVLVPTMLVGGTAAYAWADAADLVPGFITSAPLPSPQPAFITASPVAAASPTPGPVGPVDFAAPVPDAATVQALAVALRADLRTGASTNVVVLDYLTGDVLADLSASDTQVPASTTKLLTAVAALDLFGPDHTVQTTVTWTEAAARLTLVAGGDLMLASGAGHHGAKLDAEGRPVANGWAGLGDLADQVAKAVPTGAAVTLAVDNSVFPGPAWPTEWPAYAQRLGYAATVSGIAVNVGKADHLGDEDYGPRDDDTAIRAQDDLAANLTALGYRVTTVGHALSSAGAETIATVDSAPLSAVVTHFLEYSDNSVAEETARLMGRETGRRALPAGGAAATIERLAGLGVPVAGMELHDGAGFSDRNRISPMQLARTLVAARNAPNTRNLLEYLPLGGLEGTVATRYAGTPVAGFIYAKTGSLTGVTALTGVVTTADGRMLAFATLLDGMAHGQSKPQAATDEFVTALADCGCGG